MNRLMSHGQATQSTLTFSRVIHFIVPLRFLCQRALWRSGFRRLEIIAAQTTLFLLFGASENSITLASWKLAEPNIRTSEPLNQPDLKEMRGRPVAQICNRSVSVQIVASRADLERGSVSRSGPANGEGFHPKTGSWRETLCRFPVAPSASVRRPALLWLRRRRHGSQPSKRN
jgi:hypothetical protein